MFAWNHRSFYSCWNILAVGWEDDKSNIVSDVDTAMHASYTYTANVIRKNMFVTMEQWTCELAFRHVYYTVSMEPNINLVPKICKTMPHSELATQLPTIVLFYQKHLYCTNRIEPISTAERIIFVRENRGFSLPLSTPRIVSQVKKISKQELILDPINTNKCFALEWIP